MNDQENIIEVDQYNGIQVSHWIDRDGNRIWQILAMRRGSGENQVWYPVFCYPPLKGKGQGPDTKAKARPVSITLGRDRKEIIEVLRKIAGAIR